MDSCNDSLDPDDNIPDFDGCLGCSQYNRCHGYDEEDEDET